MKHIASLAAVVLTFAVPVTVPTAPAMATDLMDCWGLEGQARTDCLHAVAQEIACEASGGSGPGCPGEEETQAHSASFAPQTGTATFERQTRRPAR